MHEKMPPLAPAGLPDAALMPIFFLSAPAGLPAISTLTISYITANVAAASFRARQYYIKCDIIITTHTTARRRRRRFLYHFRTRPLEAHSLEQSFRFSDFRRYDGCPREPTCHLLSGSASLIRRRRTRAMMPSTAPTRDGRRHRRRRAPISATFRASARIALATPSLPPISRNATRSRRARPMPAHWAIVIPAFSPLHRHGRVSRCGTAQCSSLHYLKSAKIYSFL